MLIFLIDDNKVDSLIGLNVIKKILPSATIQTYHDALSAIQTLENTIQHKNDNLPELIFLDMAMPEVDGFDFLDLYKRLQLEEFHNQPLIYILTTSLSRPNVEKAKSYPAVEDVLFKGFSQKAFAAILEKHFPHVLYTMPEQQRIEPKRELTIDNWVSEYKRLETKYLLSKDKHSLEARGLLDHMEAVWSIILDMNGKQDFSNK